MSLECLATGLQVNYACGWLVTLQQGIAQVPPVSLAVRAPSLHAVAWQMVPDLDVPPMSHLLVQLLLWQACSGQRPCWDPYTRIYGGSVELETGFL